MQINTCHLDKSVTATIWFMLKRIILWKYLIFGFKSVCQTGTIRLDGSASSLVHAMAWCLFGTKPLHEPMMTGCRLNPKKYVSMKFDWNCRNFPSRNCNLKRFVDVIRTLRNKCQWNLTEIAEIFLPEINCNLKCFDVSDRMCSPHFSVFNIFKPKGGNVVKLARTIKATQDYSYHTQNTRAKSLTSNSGGWS